MKLKQILTVVALIFVWFTSPVQACDWTPPDGMTSDWVENKVVFWGRPIETKWDKSSKSDWPAYNIYTTIEVVEEVQGNLPKKIKVNHAIDGSSCGTYFDLGSIQLIVVPQKEHGRFLTGSYIKDAVNKFVVSAYITDGIDLPLPESSELLNSIYSYDDACDAKESESLTKPDFCKWESVYWQARESYSRKTKQLLEKENRKKWWHN